MLTLLTHNSGLKGADLKSLLVISRLTKTDTFRRAASVKLPVDWFLLTKMSTTGSVLPPPALNWDRTIRRRRGGGHRSGTHAVNETNVPTSEF